MRKLAPALYNLRGDGLLGEPFAVVGVGRDGLTGERYRQKIDRDLREFGDILVGGCSVSTACAICAGTAAEIDWKLVLACWIAKTGDAVAG